MDYRLVVTEYTGVPPGYEYEDQGQVLICHVTVQADSEEEAIQKGYALVEEESILYPGDGEDFWEDCDDMPGWEEREEPNVEIAND